MKKEFVQLMKEMRIALRPDFLKGDLDTFEKKHSQMLVEAGYTSEEYDTLVKEHFMDFTSDNPEEWVIRHDPEKAQIITKGQ